MARRSHTKSRKGCYECKRRHIKCNEVRPICANCRRLESDCTWPPTKPLASSASPVAASPGAASSSAASAHDASAAAAAASSSSTLKTPFNFGAPPLAIADLRLLHHFTLKAHATIGQPWFATIPWNESVVHLAFTHHFLLRGILAVSALHLATTDPQNMQADFLLQSAMHMDAALQEFRFRLQHPPETKQTYTAIFLLACLLAVHGFGSMRTAPQTDPISAFINCAGLIQGAKLVQLPSNWANVKRDDISALVIMSRKQRLTFVYQKPEIALLRDRVSAVALPSPPVSPRAPAEGPPAAGSSPAAATSPVTGTATTTTTTATASSPPAPAPLTPDIDTEADRLTYLKAIDGLNDTFSEIESCGSQKPLAMGLMCAWPASLSNNFMELLIRRRPLALVILAHFAVLLRNHEQCWYLAGWDRYLLDAIERSMPGEYEVFLAWPRSAIRGTLTLPI